MKIIIDIPTDLYEFICSENVIVHNGKKSERSVMAILLKAIKISEKVHETGYWIAQDIYNCHTDFKCSECGYIHSFMHLYGKPTADYTYCPSCGARMVEPQESEDKE